MFCSNCGSQIKEGYAFCPSCGNQVKDTTLQSGQPKHLHIEHKNLIIEKALQSTNQVAKNSFSAISNATRFFIRSLPRIIAISIVAFIVTFAALAVYSKTEIAQFEADELASKIIDYDDLLSSHHVFDVFVDGIIDKEFWLKITLDPSRDRAVININEDRISYRVFVDEDYAMFKKVYPYFNRYFGNTGVIKITNIEKGDQLAKITLENNLVLNIWRIHDADQYALAFMHDDKEVYIRLDAFDWSYTNTRTTFNEVFGFDLFENKYD